MSTLTKGICDIPEDAVEDLADRVERASVQVGAIAFAEDAMEEVADGLERARLGLGDVTLANVRPDDFLRKFGDGVLDSMERASVNLIALVEDTANEVLNGSQGVFVELVTLVEEVAEEVTDGGE